MDSPVERQVYRFLDFELDLDAHQLRRRGAAIRLERRPFQLLALLVARRGRLVTREEIIRTLWPGNVIVEFDTGLNTVVRKIRRALGDSPDAPVFIETVAGLGYRFIAPVEGTESSQVEKPIAQATPAPQPEPSAPFPMRHPLPAAVFLLVAAAVVFALLAARDRGPGQISIAVLPFENLTGAKELDYLAAGLAEETGASLAQIDLKNLRMVGRASTSAVARSDTTPAQAGRKLGVDYVVASTLRAEPPKIRVTSRLVRVSDNTEIWTASFDRELTSVLGLQRELSIAIAEQVRLRLSPEVRAAVARRQTRNPEAYDLYLRGRFSWNQIGPAGNRQALEFYERAIDRDPGYALAWAGIAHVLSAAPITADVEPMSVAARTRDALQRALASGEDLPEVQLAHGYYHFFLNWNLPAAEAAFRRATALDPNNALAHLMLGHVLSQSADQAEALAEARRARELDPFFAHIFALSATIAFQARDYAAAREFGRQAVAINPEGWVGHLNLAQALSMTGEYPEALAAYEAAERYSGNSKGLAYRAHMLAMMGREAEARAGIAALEARARARYVPPYMFALVHAGLGEKEAALEWLERAYEVNDIHLVFTLADPRWDSFRDDPRFHALLARVQMSAGGPVYGLAH